jgi:hypothetical protein
MVERQAGSQAKEGSKQACVGEASRGELIASREASSEASREERQAGRSKQGCKKRGKHVGDREASKNECSKQGDQVTNGANEVQAVIGKRREVGRGRQANGQVVERQAEMQAVSRVERQA